jgi:hypothetical protein
MKNKLIIFFLLLHFSGFSQIVRTLPNVNNTADTSKPVSSPQKIAINQKLHSVSTISALQAFTDANFAYFDGSTWERKSGNFASNGGSYAGTIINVSSSFYWERKYNIVTPQMFGAKADGTTDDITAFNNMTTFAKSKSNPVKIVLPQATYKLNNTWIVDGTTNNKGLKVEGLGNVILDFSSSVSNIGVQFGSGSSNTLYGGLKNIRILGKSTLDGLVLCSYAPYACAYNTFEDISCNNVRDGLRMEVNTTTVSVFGNTFSGNFMVEKYYRYGVYTQGTYNNFNHLFISQPSGETSVTSPNTSLGSLTLALYETGLNNTFGTVETEDQIVLNGGFCQINNLSMEHIIKGQGYAGSGVGLNINGSNVSINNLWMIEFNNTFINQLANITGYNVNLKNIKYQNSTANSLYNIAYGILPNGGSGVIENCDYVASYYADNPAFYSQVSDWDFIKCMGANGIYTKFRNSAKFTANGLKLGDATELNSNAILDLVSTTKGFLTPRMTTTQRNAIQSPAEGLEIYNLTTHVKEYFNGTVWKTITTN